MWFWQLPGRSIGKKAGGGEKPLQKKPARKNCLQKKNCHEPRYGRKL
jgi:hypothetical protein